MLVVDSDGDSNDDGDGEKLHTKLEFDFNILCSLLTLSTTVTKMLQSAYRSKSEPLRSNRSAERREHMAGGSCSPQFHLFSTRA